MSKFLKKFTTHADYNTYITGNNKILPNVSYCENNNDVHYNPWTDPRIIAKFNITDTTSATNIMYSSSTSYFTAIEIDGVAQQNVTYRYTFDTTGEHTVKYTLTNPTTIGTYAFQNCTGLTSVTIPNGVTSIGNIAFYGCTGLTSITIPSSVTKIGNSAIRNCTGLTSVTIPNGVTRIGTQAFQGCSNITSVTIPNSVTSISDSAFSGCTGLTSVTIGNSVTSIGSWVFENCSGLTSISVDSSNTVYDSRNNCNAIIKTATNTLIAACQNTVIPNTVTSIGSSAFNNCTGLTSVTIPNSVTSIGNSAFYGCTSLTTITSLATTAPTIRSNTFQDIKTGGTLTVPSGSTGYDTWMGSGNYYLGKYGWTKVEQS